MALGDSNPDRRAAFDDFGVATDMSSEQAGAGFETWEEYQRSGKQATQDFYSAEEYVTNLDEALWEKRPPDFICLCTDFR